MAAQTLTLPAEAVLAVDTHLTTRAVMVYVNGQRTEEQKTDGEGRPLFRVDGLVPVLQDKADLRGSVHVTRTLEKQIQLGSVIPVKGSYAIRGGDFGSITGTMVVESFPKAETA